LATGSDAQRQRLGSDGKSAGPVSEIDELQGVDRRVPFILRLLQAKLQLLSAAYAAPHQDPPAKPNGYPDDHPNRRDGRQTQHQADKQSWAGEGARASRYDEPAAAPDRLSQPSICALSRSICSAGVGSDSNIELSGGVAGWSDQELAAVHPQNRRRNAKQIDMPN
jgi:hypothetical protein